MKGKERPFYLMIGICIEIIFESFYDKVCAHVHNSYQEKNDDWNQYFFTPNIGDILSKEKKKTKKTIEGKCTRTK